MAAIRFELFGKLRVWHGGEILASINTNRLQSLLGYLTLNAGTGLARARIAYLLWPNSLESQARTNLRQLLHHLRRALPAECELLVADGQTVLWQIDESCTTDVSEFETSAEQGSQYEANNDDKAALIEYLRAAALYRDDLLSDLYDEWIQGKREQLRLRFVEILVRLIELLERAGDLPAAITYADKLISLDNLREPSYQLLMKLHLGNQDRASALRVYHQCLKALRRELGVTPSQQTSDLFDAALRSEEADQSPAAMPQDSFGAVPMVGRAPEVQHLRAIWKRIVQGETGLVLISGEPGIGKSKLAHELVLSCARMPGATTAKARYYYGQGQLAYSAVTEWLRADAIRATRARLPKRQLIELARILPEILLESPDIEAPHPLTESWQRQHFYEALNAAIGGKKPLLLVIDDLQCCDSDTFDWLTAFLRSDSSDHTLVVGTVRPEEVSRDHALRDLTSTLGQTGQLHTIDLGPLSAEESENLAAQVAGTGFDPGHMRNVYATTKGNPLFVVERVRAQIEDRLPEDAIPPRIQAVIEARLEKLSAAAYELAGFAAAIGKPFTLELLAKSTDWDDRSVVLSCEDLWRRKIIEQLESDTYDFTHELLRQVAYAGLNPIRKKMFHRQIARALEEQYHEGSDSISAALAAHYEMAGMAAQAIRYYREAASTARRRFADIEAADHLRRALSLCRELPDSESRKREELDLLVTLGPALVTSQGYAADEVGQTYQLGLELSRATNERIHIFSLLGGAWLYHIVRGDLHASKGYAEDCVAEGESTETPEVTKAGRFLLGTSLYHLGRLGESLIQVELALPDRRSQTHPALQLFAGPDVGVFCRAYLSQLFWQQGRNELATQASDESVSLARDISDPFSLAIALDYAAMLNAFRRDPEAARDKAEEALALCNNFGFSYYRAWAEIISGWSKVCLGSHETGLTELNAGVDALRAMGAELRLPFYYGLLAECHLLCGQPAAAIANLANGFAFQSKNMEGWTTPELHRVHGDILRESGNLAEAKAGYVRAVQSAQQIGSHALEHRASLLLAELET